MEPYIKPPLLYTDQVALFKKRGLAIASDEEAVKFLQHVNYYRFSAYCLPFKRHGDVFFADTAFEKIVDLYFLDQELRNAMLALISPIEIYLRTRLVYELSHGWGAFAHYDKILFRRNFKHPEWISALEEEIGRAKETFIDHYKSKYSGFPRLPLWMTCEIMSFGSLSLLYAGLLPDPQRTICSVFNVHHEVLKTWLHVIAYVRNVCAHHGRLWNRELAIRPEIPRKDSDWVSLNLDNRFLFAVMAVLEWICRKSALPLTPLVNIHDIMRRISTIDPRFARMMGIPTERKMGMCWGVKE